MWAKRPTWPFGLFLTTTLCWAQSGTDETNSSEPREAPLFLRAGASYLGKTASTRISTVSSTVAVLVAIDNWSRFPLIDPQTDLECGRHIGALPEVIVPGTSEMALFEKGPGFTGVCAVLTYQLELPPEEDPTYVQIMMSVPYNLNSYNAYLAVGVDTMYFNSTGLFDQLYYYSGPFERAPAGSLVEFTPEGGKVMVRGTMTPDTYKPILRVSVLPIDKKLDGFHMYSSKEPLKLQWEVICLITLIYTSLWCQNK